jgi:cytochrome P450
MFILVRIPHKMDIVCFIPSCNSDGCLRNAEVYDNPKEFRPKRWLDSSPEKLEEMKSTFLAFGYGPRICPGM